jgi:FkbM family methyltransferase
MTSQRIDYDFRGINFQFCDTKDAPALISEIFSDNYKVLAKGIDFKPGDVILDIGANEGMFSIMMGKLYPHTKIIALEPIPRTYQTLTENIRLNHCENISHYNIGVGKKGQKTATMIVSKDHSGGSTAWCTYVPTDHDRVEVGMIGLDEAFDLYGIDRCRLLKLDVEGSEFEILYSSTVLLRVDYMVMECHFNKRLEFEGRRPDGLINWVAGQTELIHYEFCQMAE